MDIPTNLKHKPVIVAGDYKNIDGRTAYAGDAEALSLGLAQWNERGNIDISAKVWRHTGEKWSRQSEELPLHRVLDLCMLICRAKQYFTNEGYRFPELYDKSNPLIERIGLQGDAMTVRVCDENEYIDTDIKLFAQALAKDDELLGERLSRLAAILKDMGYCR